MDTTAGGAPRERGVGMTPEPGSRLPGWVDQFFLITLVPALVAGILYGVAPNWGGDGA